MVSAWAAYIFPLNEFSEEVLSYVRAASQYFPIFRTASSTVHEATYEVLRSLGMTDATGVAESGSSAYTVVSTMVAIAREKQKMAGKDFLKKLMSTLHHW